MNGSALERLVTGSDGRLWLTDAGLETAMVFLEGLDLPQFASFTLLDSAKGRQRMQAYFEGFLDEAAHLGTGFVMDTATWRSNDGWADVMGIPRDRMAAINREAVTFAQEVAMPYAAAGVPVVVNGVIGPHGDAYAPDRTLTADEALDYYRPQVEALAAAGVDMLTGVTLSDVGQAVGIARAAAEAGLPVVISFTVETDGRLVSGMPLAEAVARTDEATGGAPLWYMVNCAHPDHFRDSLQGDWTGRIGGIRANASRQSHAELDEATELDDGDPQELARDYVALARLLPRLRVVGGCCGTDLRHVSAIGHACIG
ncbi:MAG: hypothetical protein RLZZ528_2478, partial [Pseudomonadota bacterium]